MLGWSFSVKEVTSRDRIDYWEGGLFSDTWLQEAVKNHDAMELAKNGGYPNLYLVKTKILDEVRGIQPTTNKWVYVEVWDQS
jgi:hypothetical protein